MTSVQSRRRWRLIIKNRVSAGSQQSFASTTIPLLQDNAQQLSSQAENVLPVGAV